MDTFIWILLLLAIAVIVSGSPIVRINYSKEYRKMLWTLILKFLVIFIISSIIFIVGFVLSFDNISLGVILMVLSVLLIIGFFWLSKKSWKELGQLYEKEQERNIYETELIKERARLRAQKELEKEKK